MAVFAAEIEGRSVLPPEPVRPNIKVRVTRRGHGKISTGVHDRTYGDELYADGEEFFVAEDIAEVLEDKGFVVLVKEVAKVEPDTVTVEAPAKKTKATDE